MTVIRESLLEYPLPFCIHVTDKIVATRKSILEMGPASRPRNCAYTLSLAVSPAEVPFEDFSGRGLWKFADEFDGGRFLVAG